jgi:hypothetical protein
MNISNLVFSASFLDLGFIKSILLFLGSGLGGLGALYINRYFQHPLQKLLPVRVIGSSAAVYGFMGAEISTCLLSVYRQATKKYNRVEKHVAQLSIASTLNLCIVRLLQFAYQLSIEGDEKVGHFGGFVTGALFSFML